MDFQSAMETFAEAWVAANTKSPHHPQPVALAHQQEQQTQAISLTTSPNRSPSLPPPAAPLPPPPPSRGPEASPIVGQSMRSSSPVSRKSSSSPAHQMSSSESIHEGINLSPNSKEAMEARKSGKSIPVHCIVEVLVPEDAGPHPRRNRVVVETDSYAIIPVITPFEELVHVALYRLGYPQDCAHLATGSVVIKNWKPLRLDRIADSPLLTVGDILGELTTVATLHIQIVKSRHSAVLDIKDKLLRLLLMQSHNLLLSSGCPLDESFLSQICRGQSPSMEPSEEVKRRFDQWLAMHQQPPGSMPILGGAPAVPQPPHPSPSLLGHPPSMASIPRPTPHFVDHRRLPHSPSKLDSLAQHPGMPDHMHPALQTVQSQYPTQKTRMRTSFDPELELPKLQRWFAENQHPSRHQIQQYVKELNALESRRGRKPLDVNNVVYWFKNARAAQKRAEMRLTLNGYSNGPLPLGAGLNPNHHMHMGGGMPLLKSPLSHNDGSLSDGDDGDMRRSQHPMQTSPYSLVTSSRNSLLSHLTRGREDEEESDDEDLEEDDSSNPTPSRNSASPHQAHLEPPSSEPLQLTCKEVTNDEDDKDIKKENKMETSFKEEMSEDEERPPSSMSPRPNTAPSSLNPSSPTIEEEIHRPTTPNSDFGPGALVPRTPGTPLDRGFPLVPNNNLFSHSIMYMSHYIPGLQQHVQSAAAGLNLAAAAAAAQLAAAASADDRRKRNRTFIDPVTEVPRLEQWFSLNTHPSHNLILKYTEELNRMPYRQKFPKLEPKNVQFWFKNRRAKCKRLKMSL
ncbi:uncharacterized protein LOC132199673 isoform X2 [Neocloeon triangulifer]|uniref:uncharacterized protein LOC132199673 isoform X2 n=1 Tax=Neocloeon triangulifer TaxID=2078957 RepID=UPI00286EDB3D|nr:uncharacterized protein LOC132199673 isoform X2 [Neocloeon triangulifer]